MKASIVIATYNGSNHIEAQLRSLLDQEYDDLEIILTDDTSRDDTVKKATRMLEASAIPHQIITGPENLGIVQNYSRGLQQASGEIVFLCDQDDVWNAQKVGQVVAEFEKKAGFVAVFNDVEMADAKLTPQGVTKFDLFDRFGLTLDNFVMGCASAYRRDFLEAILPIPAVVRSHDDYLSKCAELADGRQVLRKILQLYRIHNNNSSPFFINRAANVPKTVVLFHRVSSATKRLFKRENRTEIVIVAELEAIEKVRLYARARSDKYPANKLNKLEARRTQLENRHEARNLGIVSRLRDFIFKSIWGKQSPQDLFKDLFRM